MDIDCPVCGQANNVTVDENGGLYFCDQCESEIQIHIWRMDQEVIENKREEKANG